MCIVEAKDAVVPGEEAAAVRGVETKLRQHFGETKLRQHFGETKLSFTVFHDYSNHGY
jgi:hypothetical protein